MEAVFSDRTAQYDSTRCWMWMLKNSAMYKMY